MLKLQTIPPILYLCPNYYITCSVATVVSQQILLLIVMLRNIWNFLTDKRQLSMRDRESGEVHWKLNLSPIGLWGSVFALMALIFVGLMLVMAHTSILNIFPSYRTQSEEMHDEMTEAIVRLNSMEQEMKDMIEYYESVTTILNGSTPASQSTALSDGTRYDKSRVERSEADSLLRAEMESDDSEYALSNTKRPKMEAPIFVMPIDGHLSRGFDSAESSYDIVLAPTSTDTSVKSVEGGTVLAINNLSDGYASIYVQHSGGYISIYKNLSEVLVRRGQSVLAGTVIGRVGSLEIDNTTHTAELVLELWRDGVPVNPELYIFGGK